MLRYEETPPPEPLRPFVRSLWAFSVPDDGPASTHHIPPDGCVSLTVAPGPMLVLVGPSVLEFMVPIRPGDRFRGVRLRPEAAPLVCPAPRDWVGRRAPLAAVASELAGEGEDVDAAFAVLLDRLAVRSASAPPPDALVRRAVVAIEEADGALRIGGLAERLGVHIRTLQRRFAATTGLTPKQYARVRRFRQALGNLLAEEPEHWGRVAAELGFADQAHLVRDTVALAGEPPTAVEARLKAIEHIGVTP